MTCLRGSIHLPEGTFVSQDNCAHTTVFDGRVIDEVDGVHTDAFMQRTVSESLLAGPWVYTSEAANAFTLEDDVLTFMKDDGSFIGTTYSSSYTLASTLSSTHWMMAEPLVHTPVQGHLPSERFHELLPHGWLYDRSDIVLREIHRHRRWGTWHQDCEHWQVQTADWTCDAQDARAVKLQRGLQVHLTVDDTFTVVNDGESLIGTTHSSSY